LENYYFLFVGAESIFRKRRELEERIEKKRVFWKEGKKEESKNKRVRKEE
jgi:hypothetical protein